MKKTLYLLFLSLSFVCFDAKAQSILDQFKEAQDLINEADDILQQEEQKEISKEEKTNNKNGESIFLYKKIKLSKRSPSKIANQYVNERDEEKIISEIFKKSKKRSIPKPDTPREKKAIMKRFFSVFANSLSFAEESGFTDHENEYNYHNKFKNNEKNCSQLLTDFSDQDSVHYIEPDYFVKQRLGINQVSDISNCPKIAENFDKVWGNKSDLKPQYMRIKDVPWKKWTYKDHKNIQRKSFGHWAITQACKGSVLYDLKGILGKKGENKFIFTSETWEKQTNALNTCNQNSPSSTIYYSIFDTKTCQEQKIKMLSRFKKYGKEKKQTARSLSSNGLAYFNENLVLYHQFVCNIGKDIQDAKCGGLELFVIDTNNDDYKNLSCYLYSR